VSSREQKKEEPAAEVLLEIAALNSPDPDQRVKAYGKLLARESISDALRLHAETRQKQRTRRGTVLISKGHTVTDLVADADKKMIEFLSRRTLCDLTSGSANDWLSEAVDPVKAFLDYLRKVITRRHLDLLRGKRGRRKEKGSSQLARHEVATVDQDIDEIRDDLKGSSETPQQIAERADLVSFLRQKYGPQVLDFIVRGKDLREKAVERLCARYPDQVPTDEEISDECKRIRAQVSRLRAKIKKDLSEGS